MADLCVSSGPINVPVRMAGLLGPLLAPRVAPIAKPTTVVLRGMGLQIKAGIHRLLGSAAAAVNNDDDVKMMMTMPFDPLLLYLYIYSHCRCQGNLAKALEQLGQCGPVTLYPATLC